MGCFRSKRAYIVLGTVHSHNHVNLLQCVHYNQQLLNFWSDYGVNCWLTDQHNQSKTFYISISSPLHAVLVNHFFQVTYIFGFPLLCSTLRAPPPLIYSTTVKRKQNEKKKNNKCVEGRTIHKLPGECRIYNCTVYYTSVNLDPYGCWLCNFSLFLLTWRWFFLCSSMQLT